MAVRRGISPMIVRQVTVLPQPPRPRCQTSASCTVKETPSTARTDAVAGGQVGAQVPHGQQRSADALTGHRPQDVGEAVADQAERDADEDDGQAGQGGQPP